jgi:hypothetical protein
MPVHSTGGGGYQWGGHGKVYKGKGAKTKAARQGRAAYANGYQGHDHVGRKLNKKGSMK